MLNAAATSDRRGLTPGLLRWTQPDPVRRIHRRVLRYSSTELHSAPHTVRTAGTPGEGVPARRRPGVRRGLLPKPRRRNLGSSLSGITNRIVRLRESHAVVRVSAATLGDVPTGCRARRRSLAQGPRSAPLRTSASGVAWRCSPRPFGGTPVRNLQRRPSLLS